MRTCTLQPQIDRERSGHERSELPRERKSRHALRAVPLRGECYRTHRSAPPPAGRSSAGGMEGRKCYPCLCLKCYPCPCPPPTLTLSLRETEQHASDWYLADGRWANSGTAVIQSRWTVLPLPRGEGRLPAAT